MPDLDDVHRLAQDAHDIAKDAAHTAEIAKMSGVSHEAICAERYGVINKTLEEVKRAQSLAASDSKATNDKFTASLADLKSKADKAAGIDIAIRYAVLLLGAAGVIWGIAHGAVHVGP